MVTVEVITPWVEQVVRKVFGIEQLENGADTGIIVESLHAPASIKVGVGPGDIPNVWVTAALLKDVEPRLSKTSPTVSARRPSVSRCSRATASTSHRPGTSGSGEEGTPDVVAACMDIQLEA